MKDKKPQFKSKSIPGLSKEELNKMTNATLSRKEFMTEAHKDPERKKISSEAGIKGTDILREKGYFESESFLKMVKQNGINSGRKTMENGTGIHGRTPEQMTEDGRLGGSANSPKQVEARKKQIKIFIQAGTEAAAIAATEKFNAKIEEFIKLLPDEWISVQDAEKIKQKSNIKRFNVRNALDQSKYFKSKKVGKNRLKYKPI